MFLRVDYEQVARHCQGAELVHYGLANARERHIAGLFKVEIEFLDVDLIDRTRPAVLTVPSLNAATGQTHAVFWDGRRIWDPNHGRAGKKTYTNQQAWGFTVEGYQRSALQRLGE